MKILLVILLIVMAGAIWYKIEIKDPVDNERKDDDINIDYLVN